MKFAGNKKPKAVKGLPYPPLTQAEIEMFYKMGSHVTINGKPWHPSLQTKLL
jgi:hypothetical protein